MSTDLKQVSVQILLPVEVATRMRLNLSSQGFSVNCTDIELLQTMLTVYLDPEEQGPSAIIDKLCAFPVVQHVERFNAQVTPQ